MIAWNRPLALLHLLSALAALVGGIAGLHIVSAAGGVGILVSLGLARWLYLRHRDELDAGHTGP